MNDYAMDKDYDMDPFGIPLINPKRLFNWEGTIKKYQMKWLLKEYS